MNTTQSWAGVPDDIKRQAAPDMLAGKTWMHWGRRIEHPGADELRKWAGLAPQSAQAGAEVAGSIGTAEPNISERMTREGKRQAVDSALAAHPAMSNRELARKLGVSHAFIALRRRKVGNVAGADVGKCWRFPDHNAHARGERPRLKTRHS